MNTNPINVVPQVEVRNQRFFNNGFIKTAMAIGLIATIGLSTVNNYGVSWDEPIHIKNVGWNYELILKNQPLPKHPADIKYYGVAFDIAAETLYQLKNGFPRIEINRDRFVLKHAVTFLFSVLAYVSVAGIVGIFCGAEYAWLGSITLALFPGFWGHSFFNPKDIPFAVLFTLSTWMGAYLVEGYSKLDEKVKIGFNRFSITSILFGVLVGLLTIARIGGFVFLGFIPFTYIVTRVGTEKITRYTYKNIFISWILIFISWAIVTTVCHPVSWSNPVGWFLEAFEYHSNHGWVGTVLFDGKFILGSQLPWYYLPRIVTITVPEIFLLLFIIGLGLSVYKYSQFSNLQKACLILVLLQIFSLSSYGIVKGSTL
ncbi:hypothetical protein [Microseira wollei]|uniref:Glycosyltransferase RgtA/B/C/D-like domain-containing protein n=1 Tax=Microseira wollei NIES-4236 TaxID=2530354 RepID=A0AAV3XFD2_9CYAN|nr:hypothetical protein [Microseira wollei]GET38830.1 hypothetical protein MiSe_35890 [Microseira wollei NIES-4236]